MKTTKSSLAKQLSSEEGVPEYIAKKQVSQVISALADRITKCEKVMISGLGTFQKKGRHIGFMPSKKLKNLKGGNDEGNK
jgi:bacterial DNA-binding protein